MPKRALHARRLARGSGRDLGEDDRGELGAGEADTDAIQEQGRGEHRVHGRRQQDHRHCEGGKRLETHARGHHLAGSDPIGEKGRERSAEKTAERHGEKQRTGLERGELDDGLQVDRHDKHKAELAEPHERGQQVSVREAADAEQAQIEQHRQPRL